MHFRFHKNILLPFGEAYAPKLLGCAWTMSNVQCPMDINEQRVAKVCVCLCVLGGGLQISVTLNQSWGGDVEGEAEKCQMMSKWGGEEQNTLQNCCRHL